MTPPPEPSSPAAPAARVTPAKVPRFDYDKYRSGGAAGRRVLVDGLGDALREHGCARLQGHGAGSADLEALWQVAVELLAALEGYFGLPPQAFSGVAGPSLATLPAAVVESASGCLLWLVPEVPAGLVVHRAGGQALAVHASPGELLVVCGPGLALLSDGILPAGAVRAGAGGDGGWSLAARADATLGPREEFRAARAAADSYRK